MKHLFLDMALRRELGKSSAKCDSTGCEWTGNLKNYLSHVANCSLREIICIYCSIKVIARDRSIHQNTCTKYPIDCPNRCGKNIRRDAVESHIDALTGDCDKLQLCDKVTLDRTQTETFKAEFMRLAPNKLPNCPGTIEYQNLRLLKSLLSHFLEKLTEPNIFQFTAKFCIIHNYASVVEKHRFKSISTLTGDSAAPINDFMLTHYLFSDILALCWQKICCCISFYASLTFTYI